MSLIEQTGLPANIDAERFLIGSVLLDGERFSELAMTLELDDFSLESHRRIWNAMLALTDRGRFVDRVTVAEELIGLKQLDSVGGMTYLVTLDDQMPHIPNLGGYCSILREKKLLRDVIRMARQLEESALLGTQDASELLGRADAMVRALGIKSEPSSAFLGPSDVIRQAGGLQAYMERGKGFGIPTGFPRLDEMTGGIRPGHLWVIAANTAGGKSTLASQISQFAAGAGFPGAFVSLEMPSEEVTDGLICRAGQINTQAIRRGYDRQAVRAAAEMVAELPLYIYDRPGVTIPKLHAELRRLKAEKDIRFSVVDYLQLMQTVGKFGSRADEIGSLSRGLKLIAMDLGIGVVAISQLRRPEMGKPRRPELSDLKESSSIEQDANLVVMLWTEFQTSPMQDYPTELHVKKQRGGPVGMIPMLWRKSTGTFMEELLQ